MHASSEYTRPHAVAVAASHHSRANVAILLLTIFSAVYARVAGGPIVPGWQWSSHKLEERTLRIRLGKLLPSAARQVRCAWRSYCCELATGRT
ncbi:hypothetical protein C8Q74DRAFT_859861 [Fomes fomentarius]|nr:hypothetical protein C8Q74DRAFT_859861 [Fomes fomentarius]